MSTTFLTDVVEGQTEEIVHQLLNDGEPMLIQGMTVELVLEQKDGTSIDTTGKVDNLDDASEPNRGMVKYSPDAADFVKAGSDYYWRWQITDGSGKISFWPNDAAARLKVWAVAKP